MLKSSYGVFSLLILMLLGCASPPRDAAPAPSEEEDSHSFTDKHLDFKKWNRTAGCCSAEGKNLAVSTAGLHSTKAAMELQKRGCNLVDAAVAAAMTLAVERPQSTGVAGGGFLVMHQAGKEDVFLDFRETAPRTAKRDMFLDKEGKIRPNLSRDGVNSAGVPGLVAGLYDFHQKFGSKKRSCKWSNVLAPAIRLAEKGLEVYPSLYEKLVVRQEYLLTDPAATKIFFRNGKPLPVGELLVQKDLANTLKAIAREGKKAFYNGPMAKKMADYIRANTQPGVPHFDETDLKNYHPRYLSPLKGGFGPYTIVTSPPPSAGGVAILEILNILSGYPLEQKTAKSSYAHLLAESLRRAFADRAIIGDPAFVKDESYLKLITPGYAAELRKEIDLAKATPSSQLKPTNVSQEEKPHTAQASLLDNKGNAISVTHGVNYFFGSGNMVPGLGFFLNDEMADFAIDVGAKNLTGIVGSAPNLIEPGKRPISSMVPTIVLQGEMPVLVLGAAGSSTIISAVAQTILNDLVIWKHDLRRAVFAGRVHHQWQPDVLAPEGDAFSPETLAKLQAMGHTVQTPQFYQQVQAVDYNPETGVLKAVHDPRDWGGAEAK